MLINLKCDTCKEPSKYVTGFYDGKKGKHGVLYDCKNELCEVNQLMRAAEAEDIQKRLEIQDMDSQRGISAGYVAAKRRDAGLTMYQMSRIGGCSPLSTAHMSMRGSSLIRKYIGNALTI